MVTSSKKRQGANSGVQHGGRSVTRKHKCTCGVLDSEECVQCMLTVLGQFTTDKAVVHAKLILSNHKYVKISSRDPRHAFVSQLSHKVASV